MLVKPIKPILSHIAEALGSPSPGTRRWDAEADELRRLATEASTKNERRRAAAELYESYGTNVDTF